MSTKMLQGMCFKRKKMAARKNLIVFEKVAHGCASVPADSLQLTTPSTNLATALLEHREWLLSTDYS